MWVITTDGFYSVVAYDPSKYNAVKLPDWLKAYNPDRLLLVRVRDRADLEKIAPVMGIDADDISEQFGDYAARAVVRRSDWLKYLSDYVIDDLTYSGFKGAVHDPKRHRLLNSVWSILAGWGTVGPWERRRTRSDDNDSVRGYFQRRGGKRVWVKGYTRGRS